MGRSLKNSKILYTILLGKTRGSRGNYFKYARILFPVSKHEKWEINNAPGSLEILFSQWANLFRWP